MKVFTKGFWDTVGCKVVETLASVKVWVLVLTFAIGVWVIGLAVDKEAYSLAGSALTFMSTVVTAVVVMREGFKITAINKKKDEEKDKKEFV